MAKVGTPNTGYHENQSLQIVDQLKLKRSAQFTYHFHNFFHPFVGKLIAKLNRDSLAGMLDAKWQKELAQPFFKEVYNPKGIDIEVKYRDKEIDVSVEGPYSNYNWELFFHVPFAIAVHLSKSQRFAEAQRWFHYIFDPTSTDQTVNPPQRFWKFLAFRDAEDPMQIDQLLMLLSKPQDKLNPGEQELIDIISEGYKKILDNPFLPHAVARTRHIAYQYSVVMKYLDNLIAWGDQLFQQDTVESINEATQRYVLAANILGPRPQRIPPPGTVQAKTFAQLRAMPHDPMGNALVELEGQFPFNLYSPGSNGNGVDNSAVWGMGRTLYFCIPRNEKLLGYWDTVADRLFKIRHCMNIQGIVRPLALFDPPIDPGMLVKAAAAGLDISSIVSGLNQPVGPGRCLSLIQKALELAGEVRSLGGALLGALEKADAEHLALVRQAHEIRIHQMTQEVRFVQWQAARQATLSLLTTRKTALERLKFYQRQLDLPADPKAPDTLQIEQPARTDPPLLTEENFDDAYAALVGTYEKSLAVQKLPTLKLAGGASPAQQAGASGGGRLYLNVNEDAELNSHLPRSRDAQLVSGVADTIGAVLAMIPDFDVDLQFWGMGVHSEIFGGVKLSEVAKITSQIARTVSAFEQNQAGMAARTAGHERRVDDWLLQHNLAAHELMQIGRQILTSIIAEQIAHHEYLNIQQQIENAQEVDKFLHEKFTNEELHLWMKGEISRLYYEYYRFAFDTARKAERTMKHELMRPELESQDFVKFNYWDGGRKGLLSGEALHLDLKRMEMAYHDNNKREYEITRHVSLRQINPLALLRLKATGSCQVTIPEWLYDRDCPGHYMRRIKSVALSLPSVVGPYTSVNCTLSLLRSSLRKTSMTKDGEYKRQGSEDDRFVDSAGPLQSVVTSAASNDSGMFETNLRDDRFLPFEGAGAVSTWKIDLPPDYRAFNYASISDAILHIRYTARQGVNPTKVKETMDELLQEVGQSDLALLFSLRHDFPTEWSAFLNLPGSDFACQIPRNYFPYFTEGKTPRVVSLEVYAADGTTRRTVDSPATPFDFDAPGEPFTVTAAEDAGVLKRAGDAQVFLLIRYTL